MFASYILLILPLVMHSDGIFNDEFCGGSDYVVLDEYFSEDQPLRTTYNKDIRLTIYTLANENSVRGLTVSYEKDQMTSYRFSTMKVCCYINEYTISFVVQRESDNTLIYKTKGRDACFKLVYGYKDTLGAYITEHRYISCTDTTICKTATVPSIVYAPQQALRSPGVSVGPPSSTRIAVGSPSSTRFPVGSSTSPRFSVGYPYSSGLSVGSPPSSGLLVGSPSSSGGSVTNYPISPSPAVKPVIYPSISVSSDHLRVASDEFCKNSVNYLELDADAITENYIGEVTWGRFKLTLYRTPPTFMYGFTALSVHYVMNDIYDPRDISLGKYRICCNIYAMDKLTDVVRVLPNSNTFVFKIQDADFQYNMCKLITYSYVTTSLHSTTREIIAVESVSTCRTTFFCTY